MIAKQAIYTGRVQGVGFRYSVKQIAAGFDVQGTVRNLPDGTVEVKVMAWEEEELDAFFEEIDQGQIGSFIKETEIISIPHLEEISGFSIIRD